MKRIIVQKESDFFTIRAMLLSGTIVGSVVPSLLLVITLCYDADRDGGCMSGMGYAIFVVCTFMILYPAVFLGFIARRSPEKNSAFSAQLQLRYIKVEIHRNQKCCKRTGI